MSPRLLFMLEYLSCPSEFSIAFRHIPRAINAWWNDVEIVKIAQPVIELRHRKWRWCGWLFGENVMNWVTIESKGVNQSRKQIQRCCVYFWGCRSHRCWCDSNIVLCTIRCEFNRKSKWRAWNQKHLNLSLQMDFMWNFNGIRISFASNNIVERMLIQDDVIRWVTH